MIIVVDTKTGGPEPLQAAIWDIAAVAVDGGQIIGEFSSLVWPGRHYLQPTHRDVIERIGGFDVRRLLDEDVPEAEEVAFNFHNWVTEHAGPATSFNAEFDRKFLDAEPWSLTLSGTIKWGPCIMLECFRTMVAAGALPYSTRFSRPKWSRLSEACSHFGVPFTETHRALGDALAAAELAIKLGLDAG